MSRVDRLARGEQVVRFSVWWKRMLVVSSVLMVVSIGALFARGLNLGIDFRGGTSWQVSAPGVSVQQARDVMAAIGEGGAKVQIVGQDNVRVQARIDDPAKRDEIRQALADLGGVQPNDVTVSTVGSSWGSDITSAAIRALVVFFVLLFGYLAWRLEWRMATAAIIAVVHDIILSLGVYALFQFEVAPATLIAFLTILGYSIYDTIVVFDKVIDNEPKASVANRMAYPEMVEMSMNQVLLRSINTSVTTLIPVLSTLIVGSFILGVVTLQEFAIALTIGLTAGAYSSIFIAAPVLVFMKQREPRYQQLSERLAVRGAAVSDTAHIDDVAGEQAPSVAGAPTTKTTKAAADRRRTPVATNTVIPPRPRKKPTKRG
jgi:preprotein translocase subunit SecF